MKRLAVGFALLTTVVAAHAQKIYRCVDAGNKTYYTEKPGPGCKPTWIESTPGKAPAAKAVAKKADASPPTGPNVKQSGPMPLTAKAHCDGLSREASLLSAGKSSLPPEAVSIRLTGIQKELERSCR